MAINKNHPQYTEYIEKCKNLAEIENAEIEQFKEKRIKFIHSFDDASISIHKKYAKKLKELQKEYSFLFEEDKK